MKSIILTDGPGVFGVGNSEAEALADAVANCLDPEDFSRNVTEAWVLRMIGDGTLRFVEGPFEDDGTPIF